VDQRIAIQQAFEILCSAIEKLERSVEPVANRRLLRECRQLRQQASSVMLETLHPREREARGRAGSDAP
jgi:hypothetical protein